MSLKSKGFVERLMVENYLKELDQYTRENYQGYVYSVAKKKVFSDFILQSSASSENYSSIAIESGELKHFALACKGNDLGMPVFGFPHFYFTAETPAKNILRVIEAARDQFGHNIKYVIPVAPSEKKLLQLLKRNGMREVSYELNASVVDSLSTINTKVVDAKFTVRPAKKSDLPELIKIEARSHQNDPTSRIRRLTPAMRTILSKHWQKMVQEGSLFAACYKNKPVGSCGVIAAKPVALLASISVSPKFQGQGISKLLYHAGLSYLKKERIRYYRGVSSTKNVLASAAKMKRKIGLINLGAQP